MLFLNSLVMFGWIPIVFYLFSRFPTRQAVIIGFIVAWLFLPQKEFPLPGLPDYTKASATCYGILLATVIYDIGRFRSFKVSWVDLPMGAWCLCPMLSSITNDLGLYDGISATIVKTVIWGTPYFLGRIYLNSLLGLSQLAMGIFLGGLVYAPLCLFEVKMSPQLHRLVYGFTPFDFGQAIRYGGYRPTVFMKHGLEVGMWMMAATLIGICFWKSGLLKQVYGISILWVLAGLLVTFVLIKSTGAYFLLVSGIGILMIAWNLRSSIPILLLIGFLSIYLAQNSLTETYVTDQIVGAMSKVVPPDRIQSLEFRFNNEELLTDKAREKILFGWGGWGRSRVYEYNWKGKLVDVSITDSMWIIAFGQNGLVGLISVYLSFFIPAIAFIKRYPASSWLKPQIAPASVVNIILILYMLDSIFNSFINPIFILGCGGVAGTAIAKNNNPQLKSNWLTLQQKNFEAF